MPEGPEVRTFVDDLNRIVADRKIESIKVLGGRYAKKPLEGYDDIVGQLPLRVLEVNCKGKFIYWKLENEWSLWNSLAMTGRWGPEREKHSCLEMIVSGTPVYFSDPRHFGSVQFVHSDAQLQKKLDSLGPDMLNNPPTDHDFLRLVRNDSRHLATALMDQSFISGVGNYIKSEALYRARLSPWRLTNSLNFGEARCLYYAIRNIMKHSYEAGGASIATYKTFSGKVGTYSSQFAVYGKVTDPQGNLITRETTPDKRTSWWSPGMQK